ncbi:C40 family peptidase [Amycolatopsis pigmentata]|uniref:C40 family peptidase n=1 Tax=Amycolatopsis pigmentata TaxID=450801 RepID=A0ABW5FM21_9PSEU
MQSQQAKGVVAGLLATTAVLTVLGIPAADANPGPMLASPPANAADALAQYRQVADQAEKLNEQKLKAQEDLDAKQAELNKASADLRTADQRGRTALADKGRLQTDVDQLTDESFISGAQFAKLSALLTGKSAQEFLDRSSALDVLANNKNKTMQAYRDTADAATAAEQQAADAKSRAQAASDAAATLLNDLNNRSRDLQKQLSDLDAVRNQMTTAQKTVLHSTGAAAPNVPAATTAAQKAVNAALSRLGDPYVWGATGPNSFDCSGLTQWAYGQAGISIPRVSQDQQQAGVAVPLSQIQPGDLLFEGSPAYHVVMYLGDNKIVHAPTDGDVVKIAALPNNIYNARRFAT